MITYDRDLSDDKITMLGQQGIPFGLVFTKADKLSAAQLKRSVERYQRTLAEQWEDMPTMFVSSSEKGRGRDEILNFIEECLNDVEKIDVEQVEQAE